MMKNGILTCFYKTERGSRSGGDIVSNLWLLLDGPSAAHDPTYFTLHT